MTPAAVLSLARARGGEAALRVLPDESLARLAARGDARAFALIYERHHQELFRYCRSITRNSEDAADALQSTMAAALRALPGEERAISLRPWLFRVAHNESIALIRRRRPTEELGDEAASLPDPHGQAALRERLGRLMGDLSRLPERQRGAILMREMSGLTYAEIGSALDVSAGGARQAVYEARMALTELEAGRDMDCDEARVELSGGDGRVLRGRRLSSHLRGCPECRGFGDEVAVRRSALRVLVPPLPAAAGTAILGGILGAAGVGAGAAGSAAIGAAAGAATKSAAAVALAVAAGVGTVEVATHVPAEKPSRAPAAQSDAPRAAAGRKAAPAHTVHADANAATGPRQRAAREVDPHPAAERRHDTGGDEGKRVLAHVNPRSQKRAPAAEPQTPAPVAETSPQPAPTPAPQPSPTPPQAASKTNPLHDYIRKTAQTAIGIGLQQTQQALTMSQELLQRLLNPRR